MVLRPRDPGHHADAGLRRSLWCKRTRQDQRRWPLLPLPPAPATGVAIAIAIAAKATKAETKAKMISGPITEVA